MFVICAWAAENKTGPISGAGKCVMGRSLLVRDSPLAFQGPSLL